jgi:hypothetical protein
VLQAYSQPSINLQVVSDTLSDEAWDRFNVYSPYVYKLQNQGRFGGPYSSVLFEGLRTRRLHDATSSLLPNLKHLDWTVYRREDLRAACALLTPSITKFYFRLASDFPWKLGLRSEFARLLAELQRTCPNIVDLEMYGLPFFGVAPITLVSTLGKTLTPLLISHSAIRKLTTEQETFVPILNNLPHLPGLKHLHLLARGNAAITPTSVFDSLEPVSADCLSSLRKVSGGVVWNGNIFWTLFFPRFGHSLSEIIFSQSSIPANIPADSAVELFSVIGSSCPSLQKLIAALSVPDEHTEVLDGFLRPLLRCTKLATLKVFNWSTYDFSSTLTEDDIEAMTVAWPQLLELHLGLHLRQSCPLHHFTKPTVSLRALQVLTTKCPNLLSLKLSLDAETCPTDPPHLAASSLRTLDLGGSFIKAQILYNVAAWLGDVCPAQEIKYTDGGRCREWAIVKKTVRVIQEARTRSSQEIEELRALISALSVEASTLRKRLDERQKLAS